MSAEVPYSSTQHAQGPLSPSRPIATSSVHTSLTLAQPLPPSYFQRCFLSLWELLRLLGGASMPFPGIISKWSTLTFLLVSISSRISAPQSHVVQRAAASWASAPPQSSACRCCPVPSHLAGRATAPSQGADTSNVPAAARSCSAS